MDTGPGPSPAQATSATSKATLALIRNQERFCERLDTETDKLIENFFGILKASKINRVAKAKAGDKAGRTRNDYVQTVVSDNQIEVRSANMVAAAEDLQQLINELKQSVVLSDFVQLNKDVAEHNRMYTAELTETNKALSTLGQEIDEAIAELENAYFASKWKLPPPLSANEPELQTNGHIVATTSLNGSS